MERFIRSFLVASLVFLAVCVPVIYAGQPPASTHKPAPKTELSDEDVAFIKEVLKEAAKACNGAENIVALGTNDKGQIIVICKREYI